MKKINLKNLKRAIPRRQKKITTKDRARRFAATARPGIPYYQAHTYSGAGAEVTLLSEVVFEPPSRSSRLLSMVPNAPRWYGPKTAEDCWMEEGPLYDDRSHSDIRGLMTVTEHQEGLEKLEAQTLGGPGWREATMPSTGVGAFFRNTW